MQSNVRARVCEWTYIYGVNHYTEIASVGRCQVQTAQYHTLTHTHHVVELWSLLVIVRYRMVSVDRAMAFINRRHVLRFVNKSPCSVLYVDVQYRTCTF